jgi:pullulanase/glycogen debranching enzyme
MVKYLHRARTEAILDAVYNAMAGETCPLALIFYPTLLTETMYVI